MEMVDFTEYGVRSTGDNGVSGMNLTSYIDINMQMMPRKKGASRICVIKYSVMLMLMNYDGNY